MLQVVAVLGTIAMLVFGFGVIVEMLRRNSTVIVDALLMREPVSIPVPVAQRASVRVRSRRPVMPQPLRAAA